jgi:hypothetical protein
MTQEDIQKKNNAPLEDKIMSEIRSGRITLRSRYVFLAETIGFGSAIVLSILMAILLLNLIFFYMRATDNLHYLSFGSRGTFAFLESFPYLLVSIFIVFVFAAGYLVKRSDITYKRPFGYVGASLALFVMASGAALAYTDIPRGIEERAFSGKGPFVVFRPFLERGVRPRDKGIAGQIIYIEMPKLQIRAPFGEVFMDISEAHYEDGTIFEEGLFIIAIGDMMQADEQTVPFFYTKALRIIGEEEIEMVRRGMERYLKKREHQLPGMMDRVPQYGIHIRQAVAE